MDITHHGSMKKLQKDYVHKLKLNVLKSQKYFKNVIDILTLISKKMILATKELKKHEL
jgi:radical SAM superfamily enzyme